MLPEDALVWQQNSVRNALSLLFLQKSKYLLTFSLPKLYDNKKRKGVSHDLALFEAIPEISFCPLLRGICLGPLFPAPGLFKKCQSLSSCRSFFCSGCGLLFFVFWKLYCCRSLFLWCPVLLLPCAPCFPAQVLAYGGRRHTGPLSWFFSHRRIPEPAVPHRLFLSFLSGSQSGGCDLPEKLLVHRLPASSAGRRPSCSRLQPALVPSCWTVSLVPGVVGAFHSSHLGLLSARPTFTGSKNAGDLWSPARLKFFPYFFFPFQQIGIQRRPCTQNILKDPVLVFDALSMGHPVGTGITSESHLYAPGISCFHI